MQQSTVNRQTIQPFYKQNTVFQRDQAYYTQMLTGTRRVANNLTGTLRQSSLQKSKSNYGLLVQSPSNRITQSNLITNAYQNNVNRNINQSLSKTSAYNEALSINQQLNRQVNELLNDTNDFGNTTNVITLNHYTQSKEQIQFLRGQQEKIRKLNEELISNQAKIANFKKAAQQLKMRMNNIQSADKQIYKLLQGSVNRDRQLLQRAASGLSRGQKRQDIAKILQQIITS